MHWGNCLEMNWYFQCNLLFPCCFWQQCTFCSSPLRPWITKILHVWKQESRWLTGSVKECIFEVVYFACLLQSICTLGYLRCQIQCSVYANKIILCHSTIITNEGQVLNVLKHFLYFQAKTKHNDLFSILLGIADHWKTRANPVWLCVQGGYTFD